MHSKQSLECSSRKNKQSRFDKRLILKIVNLVEQGLPRQEVVRIYKVGYSTLNDWMKRFGSNYYHDQLKRQQYTALQKRTVVSAIEQGRMSISEAQVIYKIKAKKSIQNWLEQFKAEKVEVCTENQILVGKKKKVDTTVQTAALQRALQEAELKIKALNTLIDVAEEQLKISIRKKSGAMQS